MVDKKDLSDFDEKVDKARDILKTRQQAYHGIFGEEKSVHAKTVLEDLARFCRAELSTFHADPRIHASLEGRREVWLRIQEHLKLSQEELEQKVFRKWGANERSSRSSDRGDDKRTSYRSGTAERHATDPDAWFDNDDNDTE